MSCLSPFPRFLQSAAVRLAASPSKRAAADPLSLRPVPPDGILPFRPGGTLCGPSHASSNYHFTRKTSKKRLISFSFFDAFERDNPSGARAGAGRLLSHFNVISQAPPAANANDPRIKPNPASNYHLIFHFTPVFPEVFPPGPSPAPIQPFFDHPGVE